jgi:hypothetical protein
MTDEERKAEKARRMLEKSMRMPVNNVVLEVQKGVIDIKDLFAKIEAKVKEGR